MDVCFLDRILGGVIVVFVAFFHGFGKHGQLFKGVCLL